MAAAAIGMGQPTTAKARLAGTWSLVSCVRTNPEGHTSFPWGENPVGQIIYLGNGRVSAQIMRPGRRSSVPPSVDYGSSQATDQEIREAVDEAAMKVSHHIEAALWRRVAD